MNEYIQQVSLIGKSTNNLGSVLSIIGIIVAFLVGALALYIVPSIISTWKLYEKAGQPGWSSIIPYYSTYVMGVIAKKVPIALASIGLSVLVMIMNNDSMIHLKGIISLLTVPLTLYLFFCFATQYDRKTSFWLFYIFLPIVAVFKVKDANYIGGDGSTDGLDSTIGAQTVNGSDPKNNQQGLTDSAAWPVPSTQQSVSSQSSEERENHQTPIEGNNPENQNQNATLDSQQTTTYSSDSSTGQVETKEDNA